MFFPENDTLAVSLEPTFLLDEGVHLLLYAVVPVGDVHVERVVAAGLLIGPLPPLVVGLHQAAAGLWDDMIHWRGWSAEQLKGKDGDKRREKVML